MQEKKKTDTLNDELFVLKIGPHPRPKRVQSWGGKKKSLLNTVLPHFFPSIQVLILNSLVMMKVHLMYPRLERAAISPLLQVGRIHFTPYIIHLCRKKRKEEPNQLFTRPSHFLSLGSDYDWVVGRIWQRGVVTVVQKAIAPATVADEEEGSEEDQRADGAGLSLQQEAEQVEAHKHGVVEPQRWVQRLWDEQYRK